MEGNPSMPSRHDARITRERSDHLPRLLYLFHLIEGRGDEIWIAELCLSRLISCCGWQDGWEDLRRMGIRNILPLGSRPKRRAGQSEPDSRRDASRRVCVCSGSPGTGHMSKFRCSQYLGW